MFLMFSVVEGDFKHAAAELGSLNVNWLIIKQLDIVSLITFKYCYNMKLHLQLVYCDVHVSLITFLSGLGAFWMDSRACRLYSSLSWSCLSFVAA